MAKRCFESTYAFHAETCIDYACTCSKCGKPYIQQKSVT